MANPEHLSKLKEGVAAWNKWREENPKIKPELRGITLRKAQLQGINFRLAALEESTLEEANLIKANLSHANLIDVNFAQAYLQAVQLSDVDQDYLDTLEIQLQGRWGKFWFWAWGLTDYGRSLMSVVVLAVILMILFGWAYSHWPQMVSTGGRPSDIFTPYYFSIVTYTTLGFGDVKPNNLAGEILVSLEVILGYVTLGLLLAVLSDKIARRA